MNVYTGSNGLPVVVGGEDSCKVDTLTLHCRNYLKTQQVLSSELEAEQQFEQLLTSSGFTGSTMAASFVALSTKRYM